MNAYKSKAVVFVPIPNDNNVQRVLLYDHDIN